MFVFPLADQLNANLIATNEAVFCETKKNYSKNLSSINNATLLKGPVAS
jgi:hypothetical protein